MNIGFKSKKDRYAVIRDDFYMDKWGRTYQFDEDGNFFHRKDIEAYVKQEVKVVKQVDFSGKTTYKW